MFIFDARKIISFDQFNSFINDVKSKFSKKKKEVLRRFNILGPSEWNGEVDYYQNFRKEYRKCIMEMFESVISFYKPYLPINHLILLEGSYGRDSDRIYSDIDYTLIYDEEKNDYFCCVEELINLSLALICEISRDKVHSIFTYVPSAIEEKNYLEAENSFQMVFSSDKVIEYCCRKNTIPDVVSNMLSVRDYDSFLRYLETEMKDKNYTEWLYSFKIVENTSEHDFENDLYKLEIKYGYLTYHSISPCKNTLDSEFTIAALKKNIKYEVLDRLYLFISYIRKINQVYTKQFEFLNVEAFFNNRLIASLIGEKDYNDIRKRYVEYLFLMNRLEISLKKRDIELSSHVYDIISISEIRDMLLNDWAMDNGLVRILSLKNELNELYNRVLLALKERFEVSFVSFPCSPREQNKIEKCLPYLFADYFGRMVGYSKKIATYNVLGLKDSTKYLSKYREFLLGKWGMEFNKEINDQSIIEFALSSITALYNKQFILAKEKEVYICDCGKVELCVDDTNSAYLKSDLFEEKKQNENIELVCKLCGSVCKKYTKKVLTLKLNYDYSEMQKIEIYPISSKKQYMEILKQMHQKEIMISRNRETGIKLILDCNEYNIDVDFIWLFIFSYLKDQNIIALTGNREIFYVYLAAYLNNYIFKKDVKYITLPYVDDTERFEYELTIEKLRLVYLTCANISKQRCKITNSVKIALSKKRIFEEMKNSFFYITLLDNKEEGSFYKFCNNIIKNQSKFS